MTVYLTYSQNGWGACRPWALPKATLGDWPLANAGWGDDDDPIVAFLLAEGQLRIVA